MLMVDFLGEIPAKPHWLLTNSFAVTAMQPATENPLENLRLDITQNRVEFVTRERVQPQYRIMSSPPRLVIDLPGVTLIGSSVQRSLNMAIQIVRVGQLDNGTARIVLEFATNLDIDSRQVQFKRRSPNRWSVQLPAIVATPSNNYLAFDFVPDFAIDMQPFRASARIFNAQTQNLPPNLPSLSHGGAIASRSLAPRPPYSPIPKVRLTYIQPTIGTITRGFGLQMHPILKEMRSHQGIDIAAPLGTPIMAAAAGVVKNVGWDEGGFGNRVEISHQDGSTTFYGHANRVFVTQGELVKQGQLIAEVGSTGLATGTHVHFEIRPDGKIAADPISYLSNSRSLARAGLRYL